MVPDFIPNICEISVDNNSDEFGDGNISIEHENVGNNITSDDVSNVNIGQGGVVHEQPIDGTPVAANNDVGEFHFFISSLHKEGSRSGSDEIVTPPPKRVRTRGGVTVGRLRTRGSVRHNRGGVRRNGHGGRIGNPLSQNGKILKNVNFKDFQYHEIEGCNCNDDIMLDFLVYSGGTHEKIYGTYGGGRWVS